MSEPRTLNEAREQLETVTGRIAELTTKLAAYENSESLAAAGIVRVDDEKGVHFSVPRIPELEATVSELTGKVTLLEAEAVLTRSENKAAIEKITLLEASAKTVESRAREMLASQGGPALPVDGSGLDELTPAVLRTQLNGEKDPVAYNAIYQRLKTLESKTKSRRN